MKINSTPAPLSFERGLHIKKIHAKTTARYHFTPPTVAMMKKWKTTSVGRDVEKLGRSYTACRNVRWFSHDGK